MLQAVCCLAFVDKSSLYLLQLKYFACARVSVCLSDALQLTCNVLTHLLHYCTLLYATLCFAVNSLLMLQDV
jgi:hypothetical protein